MFYKFFNSDDDIPFTFSLHGEQGTEKVYISGNIIYNGNEHTGIGGLRLTTTEMQFVALNNEIRITFENDGGSVANNDNKDVYFISNQTINVEGPTGNSWNCGSDEEDYRCNRVRDGNFNWGGEYVVTLLGKYIV